MPEGTDEDETIAIGIASALTCRAAPACSNSRHSALRRAHQQQAPGINDELRGRVAGLDAVVNLPLAGALTQEHG